MKPDATTDERMPAQDYREAAVLREGLRPFLRRTEWISAANGLAPQRLLLLITGAPDRSERSTVTNLAGRTQLAQDTVTDRVARAEAAGLPAREQSEDDGRIAYRRLPSEGERRLAGTVASLNADRRSRIALVSALDRSRRTRT